MKEIILLSILLIGLLIIPNVKAGGLLMTAGTIKLNVSLGETSNIEEVAYSTFESNSNYTYDRNIIIYATGEGAKYLNIPSSLFLKGLNCTSYNIKYNLKNCKAIFKEDFTRLSISATIPLNYSGNKTIKANIYALLLGKCEKNHMSICINIQMGKLVIININKTEE